MRIVAVICNVFLFGFACSLLLKEGVPNGGKFIVFLLLFLTPVLSLVVLFRTGATGSWLDLYLRRKALEEQRKIDGLSNNGGT